MTLFAIVLARDELYVKEKINELETLGCPYLIVCGKKIDQPHVAYRKPKGKYDAINFGFTLIPKNIDIIVLNDVDTKINNLKYALQWFNSEDVALVFTKVRVKEGPQNMFYKLLDTIRTRLPIAASGELMLIKYDELKKIVPIKSCKAEDSYILFKVLENRKRAVFSKESYVVTERTKSDEKEEMYKRKTVCGIYQALSYTRPPIMITLFYLLLPIASPILLILGKKGYFWMKGILLALIDYLRGDFSGVWQPTYMG